MSKIQSHADCTHESTKAARAKCRRQRIKFGDAVAAVFAEKDAGNTIPQPEPVALDHESDEGVEEIETEDEEIGDGETVTRENWKEFRDREVTMEVVTYGVRGNSIVTGKITGWGEKKVRYQSATGHFNMIDAERVVSATAL